MSLPGSQQRNPSQETARAAHSPRRAELAKRRTGHHRPWSTGQVRVADRWPTRKDQPVSLALAPSADLLAVSVGQRLVISQVSGRSLGPPVLQLSCALTPALTWSPRGDKLAFRDDDGRGRVLDLPEIAGGRIMMAGADIKMTTLGIASALAFAPIGDKLVVLAPSLPGRTTLTLLGPDRAPIWECALTRNRMFTNRSEGTNLAWSPDGRTLACTIGAETIWLIDAADGTIIGRYDNHELTVTGLSWIDDERIVSASEDATLQLWRPDGAAPTTVVETIPADGMVFVRERGTALIWSASGELFAWSLANGPTQLWYRDPPSRSVAAHFTRLAVSAVRGLLVLVDAGSTELVIISDWDRTPSAPTGTTTYANAKVLLLGDSGVGKSGLGMVLAGEAFRATESTHGRRIWQLPTETGGETPPGDREVLIWDLAGQPGYRIVHQMHLGGAALALIVFDSRNESAPLLGVRHWARAVQHAHPSTAGGLPIILVAARTDRGGIDVSPQRIRRVMDEFDIDAYLPTSALEGTNTDELRSKILAAIDWDRIPKITSTALFAAMKRFVKDQKSAGNLLTPLNDLISDFQLTVPSSSELLSGEHGIDLADPSPAELTAVFEGCIARLESAGIVKRLHFGDLILLQPELLDTYASAIVNAARDEPDGLGSILEDRVSKVDFPVPSVDRVLGKQQERLLVWATLEELIYNELVLREETPDGVQLVFPSAYRRDMPTSETPRSDGVVFRFEGQVDLVYAALIVRLTRSNSFTRTITWQSAARFAAQNGQCTVFLRTEGDGKAELEIGYDRVKTDVRLQFERFVHTHLERRATLGTVTRERQYCCPDDSTAFTREQVEQVRERGRAGILCPVCENRVSLRDDYEPTAGTDQITAAMEASADRGRQFAVASAVLRGKQEAAEFDVFLCHNVSDKPAVRELAERLMERGLRPWLDERELRPGLPWQQVLESQIQNIPAAAVIVGSRIGPWQNQELEAFLRQFAKRRCPVIPVLLPGAICPDLPLFLDGMTWVDLGAAHPDPYDQLEWGITGKRPEL